jgi:mono/diheme cytochrome c family protein/uncharacterized membrane protein SirB2
MPIIAVQHTHVLVVVLFLILFIIKAFLLFTNKHQTLEKMKKSTKVLDMIFGTLILVTGGYLLFQYNGVPTWLIVKIVLVLAAIPLAIVGIKKHNKPLVGLALIIFIYVYGVAETKSLNMKKEHEAAVDTSINNTKEEGIDQPADGTAVATDSTAGPDIEGALTGTALANAKEIYTKQCASCHGEDGKKGLGNAADLSVSNLTIDQQKAIILNGKGLMPAFQGQISEQ